MKKDFRRLAPFLAVFPLFFFGAAYLTRDLWFDEALTLMNFALAERPSSIYFNYVIPNNQIVYTFLLRGYFELAPRWFDLDCTLRLLSLAIGCATLLLLYFRFKTRAGGRRILLPALIALGGSVPFLVYATALRGYMLSAFLAVLTLDRGLEYARRGGAARLALYALGSFLLTGTIPTNLAVSAAIVLYLLPLFGNAFYRKRRFWIAALTPPAMFALFYGPLLRQFLGVLRLGEGWSCGVLALQAVALAAAVTFAVPMIPALAALPMLFRKTRGNRMRPVRAAIWLLPVPILLLLPTTPFPRVFFPFWPLWALLTAEGIRDFTAHRRLRRRNSALWLGALLLAAFGWCAFLQDAAPRRALSKYCGGAGADDFFYGYYLRPNHTARRTIDSIVKECGIRPLYLSFAADPWALMFYGRLAGMTQFAFDGPRGRVPNLDAGTLAVLRADEAAEPLVLRFHRNFKLLLCNENHAVYLVQ